MFVTEYNFVNKLTLKDNNCMQFYFVYMQQTLPPF